MAIPDFDEHGLLPAGVHVCTMAEIGARFGWNQHRVNLVNRLDTFLTREIRPTFREPLDVDGSFVTDKQEPVDVDVVLDLRGASDLQQFLGWRLMRDRRDSFTQTYSVDFWINLPGQNDLGEFFQYVGVKASASKGLPPRHLKGILRVL